MNVFGIYCFGKLCMVWLFFGIGIFDNDCWKWEGDVIK